MKNEFDWLSDFDIDRTIGGLALLKVNYIGNVLANNILNSAIRYLKEYKDKGGITRDLQSPGLISP